MNPPQIGFGFHLSDGTTAAREDALQLSFGPDTYDSEAEQDLMTATLAILVLQTWPERTPVAFSASGRPTTRVIPGEPLQDRWYVMGFSADLPADVISHSAPLPDGLHGVRFTPGSHPRFRNFRFCRYGLQQPGILRLYADFSEPVTLDESVDTFFELTLDGAQSFCPHEIETKSIRFDCPAFPRNTAAITATSGGYSATDVRLQGGSWSFDLSGATFGDCQEFPMPI
jgi:hypothetical protein